MNRESAWYKKNTIRFTGGGLAIFVIFQICDFIIHRFILGEYFTSLSNVGRQDVMSYMWIMYLGSFIFSFLMMYIFIKGFENRGIMEGVRFGILFGTVTAGMGALYQYILFPVPFSLVIQWFGYQLVKFILAGIAAGYIYKPLPEDDRDEEQDDMEIV
ncbi:MAG TPA: hypothetical protein PK514_10600 [Spirochaetota bacterium]|nr:hypothetical protein [Spirochaetota bacterium]